MIARLKSFFRSATHRNRLEHDIDAEIRFHLEARTDDLIREGLSPREAARRARLEFGAVESHKDSIRKSLNLRWLDDLRADLAYAFRILRKSPGFTIIAVASLALAIGANTTIFSFANQMLFVKLGVPDPEQLRSLVITGGKQQTAIHDLWGAYYHDGVGFRSTSFSYPVYRLLAQQQNVLQPIFACKNLPNQSVTAAGVPRATLVEAVSGNFYSEMRVRPQLGRAILPSDDGAPGSSTVAILGNAFWHRVFAGAPDVLGKTITVNMQPVTIIGVNPPSFLGPDGVQSDAPDVFVPLSMITVLHPASSREDDPFGPELWWVRLGARARPGISNAQAEAALNVIVDAAVHSPMTVAKDETIPQLHLEDGSRGQTIFRLTEFAKPLYVLLALASLVLLLACANIANLMLARATFRQREIGVRMALGASRSRVLRQVLTESLAIALMGGAGGLFLGYLGRNLIPWLTTNSWQGGTRPVSFDWRVFGFTSAVTLLTGILFGIAPAWRLTHSEINATLKDGATTATRKRRAWSSKSIVGFQVALSTLLVISAVLFLRTVINLNSIDPGFSPEHLLLFNIAPPASRYPGAKEIALHHKLEEAVTAVPGVETASLTDVALISESSSFHGFDVEGAASVPGGKLDARSARADVGEHFFSVMTIPILAGRSFTQQDTATSPPVAIINQTLAGKFFPDTDPIGHRFRVADTGPGSMWVEIIGICADTRYRDMREPVQPVHFDLYSQKPDLGGATYIVRSQLPPDNIVPALRRAVQQIDPDLPLTNIRTQQQQIAATMQQERLLASLTAGFGILALALACVGIYGIMAYTVSQRTNEIGIRLALGAARGRIRTMILREAGWMAVTGVIIGLAAAFALMRLIQSMLYGLKPGDPLSLVASAFILLAISLIAAWVPALRASHVEPMEALRHD
jgi:predicted permease